jgi:hypothetical protein
LVKIFFIPGLLLLGILGLFSEEFTSKVTVSSESVGVNETFQMNIEVYDKNKLEFQGLNNLDQAISINYAGWGSQSVFQNGVMTSSQVYSFYVNISKAGKFTIGPFKFKVKDKIYQTDSIDINVISLNSDASSNNVTKKLKDEDLQNIETQDKKNSNYILRISADKKEAYINEPVEIIVKFYKRNDLQMVKPGTLNLPANSWIENTFDQNESYAGITQINDLQFQEYVTEKKRVFRGIRFIIYLPLNTSFTVIPVMMFLQRRK